jgi:hypothetical protein
MNEKQRLNLGVEKALLNVGDPLGHRYQTGHGRAAIYDEGSDRQGHPPDNLGRLRPTRWPKRSLGHGRDDDQGMGWFRKHRAGPAHRPTALQRRQVREERTLLLGRQRRRREQPSVMYLIDQFGRGSRAISWEERRALTETVPDRLTAPRNHRPHWIYRRRGLATSWRVCAPRPLGDRNAGRVRLNQ